MKQLTYPAEVGRKNAQTSNSISRLYKRANISVYFKQLEVNRAHATCEHAPIRYNLSIYLGEAFNSGKHALLQFVIKAKTDPDLATFNLKGGASIKGPPEALEEWLALDKDRAPKIWVEIYRETLSVLNAISSSISLV